jgi:hypothetical protein
MQKSKQLFLANFVKINRTIIFWNFEQINEVLFTINELSARNDNLSKLKICCKHFGYNLFLLYADLLIAVKLQLFWFIRFVEEVSKEVIVRCQFFNAEIVIYFFEKLDCLWRVIITEIFFNFLEFFFSDIQYVVIEVNALLFNIIRHQ